MIVASTNAHTVIYNDHHCVGAVHEPPALLYIANDEYHRSHRSRRGRFTNRPYIIA
jgi:hypothetical protein